MPSSLQRRLSTVLATTLITGGLATAVSAPASAAVGGALLYGLTSADHVVSFRQATPGTTASDLAITGIGAEHLVGFDIRPATGDVVALSDAGKLYTLVPATGVATLVAPVSPAFTGGADAGVDFNPVPDRLRLTGANDQNLRVVPTTGVATSDTVLAYAAGDPNVGVNPNIEASAYTNSIAGALSTTLYDIDTALDVLAIQNPPNNGQLNTVGALGVDATGVAGLDIDADGGTAYALLTVGGVQGIYTINLITGAATLVGAAVPGLVDVTVATPRFRVAAVSVVEGSGGTVTITRTGDLADAATVDYATSAGTATAGTDYTQTSGTATFAPGASTATFAVSPASDLTTEGAETVAVTLSNASAGTLLSPPTSTVTITEAAVGYALLSSGSIATFALSTPGTFTSTVAITGLTAGDVLVGIDVRPATGDVIAVGQSGRVYSLNPVTGAATATAGTPPVLAGTSFGVDVNPVPDKIRVVSDGEQNLRLDPVTGAVAGTDTVLAYAPGDPNNGVNPNVIAAAYTDSFPGTASTTLYDIDSSLGILAIQSPPNNGTLTTVGTLGVAVTAAGDLDIAAAGNTAFAALTPVAGAAALYRINLTTGAATSLGAFASSLVTDIAIASPGRLGFASNTATVLESAGSAVLTVNRTAGTTGPVTIDYATASGTATVGFDFAATTGTLAFAAGQATGTISIPIVQDTDLETSEDFTVTLSNAGGGAGTTAPLVSTVTITDDEVVPGPGSPTAPGAPTIGTAVAGDKSASVSFTAPASTGGSAITGYTVTSSPGGLTASGSTSPIVVSGLTNGVSYTFTVKANNAVGTGAASTASNSVTPTAASGAPTFILGTNVIAAGQTTKVVVTGDAADKVDVLVKGAASTSYTVIATLTLNSAGGSSLIVSPSTTSSYVVRNATGSAAAKSLLVKAVQSVVVGKSGTTGVFTGLVKPSLQGRTVIVYGYVTGGHVATLCSTVVRAGGKFACDKPGLIKGQTYHVFAQTGADTYNAAGRSGLKDLTI